MKNSPSYNYLERYLIKVQSKGRFSLTLKELTEQFNISQKAILQSIYRLKSKGLLAQVRKEFYAIIPPQYSDKGILPPALFINDMMGYLEREYYVGLLSAAALHGAGHQQPMEFQVMTKKPALRPIMNQLLYIRFFTKKKWEKELVVEIKTDAGFINVSSPELTLFDLVFYSKRIGGINRVIPVIEELAEVVKPSKLALATKSQITPTAQRLGYLLYKMGNDALANSLYSVLDDKKFKEAPLSHTHRTKQGELDNFWKVAINTTLDF